MPQSPAPSPRSSSELLEELSADDILESEDIATLDAAAGTGVAEAPLAEPSGFEVGDMGAFDEDQVEVEGLTTRSPAPVAVPRPAVARAAVPRAPVTSPLPLESVIVSEPASEAIVQKTLELRSNDMANVAAAAAKLAAEPERTEVLVRSEMPAALQTAGATRPYALTPAAPQAQNARPSSIAPVALDGAGYGAAIAARPAAMARGTSGVVIGGLAAAAILLVSLVGVGGYAASRALSAKSDAVASAPAGAAAQPGSDEASPAAAPSEAAGAASAPVDVSSLPSAPAPGATPRALSGKGSLGATPPPTTAAPVSRSSGGALSAPGGGKNTTPVAAPAPAPAAPAATTGVVRVDPNLRAVVVDGSYRRANDGTVTLSCGKHRIKAGMKDPQTVNVPCGGSVSL